DGIRDFHVTGVQTCALPIFPWNGQYLIGTTDIRYDGDPAEAAASDGEIGYLLAETNRIFPQAKLGTADIHYTYAGVRPLPRRSEIGRASCRESVKIAEVAAS